MNRFYGHLLGREAFQNEKLWPYPTVDAIARSSILSTAAATGFSTKAARITRERDRETGRSTIDRGRL